MVEDFADFRTSLTAFFELLGYHARFVADAASALRAAREEAFDVLLTDIGLPDADGWELLGQMEAIGRRPPYAIAMSGYGLNENLVRSREAGFHAHLIKPFDPEDLEKILQEVSDHLQSATTVTKTKRKSRSKKAGRPRV